MARTETTLLLDDELMRRVTAAAAGTGKEDHEVIEAALRRYLKLDVLDEIWAKNGGAPLDDRAADGMAHAELRAVRRSRRMRW